MGKKIGKILIGLGLMLTTGYGQLEGRNVEKNGVEQNVQTVELEFRGITNLKESKSYIFALAHPKLELIIYPGYKNPPIIKFNKLIINDFSYTSISVNNKLTEIYTKQLYNRYFIIQIEDKYNSTRQIDQLTTALCRTVKYRKWTLKGGKIEFLYINPIYPKGFFREIGQCVNK